mgnify:CR=1 FL=1
MKRRRGMRFDKLLVPESCLVRRGSKDPKELRFHKMMGKQVLVAMVVLALLLPSADVEAVTLGFTDSTAFQAALPGPASIVNFDNVNAGTPIPDGVPFQDISLTSNVDNVLGRSGLIVSAQFLTTSPLNFLGVNDGFTNEFLFGDELTLNFSASVLALGLSIIASPDVTQDTDFLLVGGGGSAFNAGTPEQTLFDGGEVFFLGLISDQAFNSAQLISFGDQLDTSLGFNVDDITSVTPANPATVPEPSTVLLFGTGLLILAGMTRSKKAKPHPIPETV